MCNHVLTTIFLSLIVLGSVSAQELYIRNDPFEGPVAGSGADLLVGLTELAEALEFEFREADGVYFLDDTQAAGAVAGDVVIEGQALKSSPGESGPMVNLKSFAELAGLRYVLNRELGTIDITMTDAAMKGGRTELASQGHPIIINKDTPGELVEDLNSLIVPGKLNFFLWYVPGQSDSGYRAAFREVDRLVDIEGVVLYKINVGHKNSPLAKAYPGMLPRLIVVKGRRAVAAYNGHSINSALKNPEGLVESMRRK
jgi:hypothetical protein